MQELVMIGFTDKHRAIEVLPQLQRLKFDWCTDLENAVAVEVERDGRLRLHQSQLLDPGSSSYTPQWKGILNMIVPLPHVRESSVPSAIAECRDANARSQYWLQTGSLEPNFIRDAAALLRPGHSAILAVIGEARPALAVFLGYSYVVLHTPMDEPFNSERLHQG
jgi:uncharacterized membrane protein